MSRRLDPYFMTSFDDRGYLQPAVRKDKTAPSRAFQKRSTELRCEPLRGYRKQEATPTGCCPFVVCLLLLLLLVLLVLRLDVAVAHCCLLLFSFAAFLFAFNDNATALCVYATANPPASSLSPHRASSGSFHWPKGLIPSPPGHLSSSAQPQ